MGDVSLDMIWKRLEDVHGEVKAVRTELATLDHKVGAMAQTLIGVQKDIRQLTNSVGTLGAAVDEHTHRLDRIETRLNLHDAE
jgi:hypothetical protein